MSNDQLGWAALINPKPYDFSGLSKLADMWQAQNNADRQYGLQERRIGMDQQRLDLEKRQSDLAFTNATERRAAFDAWIKSGKGLPPNLRGVVAAGGYENAPHLVGPLLQHAEQAANQAAMGRLSRGILEGLGLTGAQAGGGAAARPATPSSGAPVAPVAPAAPAVAPPEASGTVPADPSVPSPAPVPAAPVPAAPVAPAPRQAQAVPATGQPPAVRPAQGAPIAPDDLRTPAPRVATQPEDQQRVRMSQQQYQQTRLRLMSDPAFLRLNPQQQQTVLGMLEMAGPAKKRIEKLGDEFVEVSDDASVPPRVVYRSDKPTTEQQNYNFYVDQEKAAGRTPTNFETWSRDNKRAGATTLGENESEKQMAKASVEAFDLAQKAASDASRRVTMYGQMLGAMEGFVPGATAEARLAAMSVLKDLGLIKGDNVAPGEAFRSVQRRLELAATPKGQGQITENERFLIREQIPTIATSPEGVRLIIQMLHRLDQYDMQVAKIWRDNVKAHGGRPNYLAASEAITQLGPPLTQQEQEFLNRQGTVPRAQPQQQGQLPRVSPEEAAKLPKGTRFIGADGNEYVRQ